MKVSGVPEDRGDLGKDHVSSCWKNLSVEPSGDRTWFAHSFIHSYIQALMDRSSLMWHQGHITLRVMHDCCQGTVRSVTGEFTAGDLTVQR